MFVPKENSIICSPLQNETELDKERESILKLLL